MKKKRVKQTLRKSKYVDFPNETECVTTTTRTLRGVSHTTVTLEYRLNGDILPVRNFAARPITVATVEMMLKTKVLRRIA